MKKQLSENWQLWILMALVFLALAAGARKTALDLEWSEFNANILFIVSFAALSVFYLIFHELFVKLAFPLLDKLFKKLGFKPRIESEDAIDDRIIIDYGTTRGEKIRKQEKRYMELESRVIKYIGDTMAHYMSEAALSKLIDRACEFFHMKLIPDFQQSDSVIVSDELSTMDLMHLGWNIAKPFRKPCAHTALFLKQIFPEVFSNTEVFTIEKKLCLSPMQGKIKINRNVGMYGVIEPKTIESMVKPVKSSEKELKQGDKSAKQAAIADMLDEGIAGDYDFEDMLIEE